jgi:putative endonuclease
LIYYELYQHIDQAIAREKQLKGWLRVKKEALIATTNPEWSDLAADWYEGTDDTGPSPSSRLRMTE